jgi:hypothetical protein
VIARLALSFSCLATATGCGAEAAPKPLKALAVENRDANAFAIAEAVRRLCIENVVDGARFETALRGTGWTARQTQEASPEAHAELDVWRVPSATLVRSPRPIAERVWTCSIAVDAKVAPSEQRMIQALNALAGGNRTSKDIGWQWKPSLFRAAHMTLGASSLSGEPEMMIFVEVTKLTPLQALLGS